MKILVTGTAGFIGFHVVERLLKEGHEIVGIDSINDYYDTNLKYGRLAVSGIPKFEVFYNQQVKSQRHVNYRFYQLLLEDEGSLMTLFEKEKFDIVINLAAQAGVRYSLENAHAYIRSNISGFLNILECSRRFSIKHLVYASSSSVYGLNNDTILSTSYNVYHPVSLYSASKRSNELMAHVYSHLYNLPVTGLRFFTVYGPWGRPDMAPMLFTSAILKKEPIYVFNNGEMSRDFTYIDDIVEGVYRVALLTPTKKEDEYTANPLPSNSTAPFAIYNIGNNKPVKLMDFISVLEKEIGAEAIKNFKPMQPGDVMSTFADVSPLVRDMNYSPSTSLETGIKYFVEWYNNFYHT